MKQYIILFFSLFVSYHLLPAQTFSGNVRSTNDAGERTPVPGAVIVWLNTSSGTVSDAEGNFRIERTDSSQTELRISFIGYTADTINVDEVDLLNVLLTPVKELGTLTVTGEASSTVINTMNAVNTETLGHGELKKAACCNLSESFETNATVDAEYSDAISGTRTIKMLGLDGVYAQIMTENMPGVRGLASSYGLTYIPGPWIESIQITKGPGSVVNGYEAISGAINTELKKPYETEEESFLLNLYGSNSGRIEANMNVEHKFNEKLSTAVFTHTSQLQNKLDDNEDSFLDAPLTSNYIFMNRWDYRAGEHYEAQAGIKYISSDITGGQLDFDAHAVRDTANGYGVGVQTRRLEAFVKNGFIAERPSTSLGIILSGVKHEAESFYGLNDYSGTEDYLHANVIGQTFISNTSHLIKAGFSFMHDAYDETYDSVNYVRNENVPGVFAEYYFNRKDKWSLLAGSRVDLHNLYGTFFSPRLHFRYAFTPENTLRLSAGKGYRVANIFAENSAVLMSSRHLMIANDILPEEAWNYGITFIHLFHLFEQDGTLTLDAYRTDFVNQLSVDLEQADMIMVNNLQGTSYSNAIQAEVNYTAFKNFDLRMAYKYVDAKETYAGVLKEVPLTFRHRGLVNASYKTNKGGWVFDATGNFYGSTRLPDLSSNEEAGFLPQRSPGYVLFLAQITKNWKNFNIYAGSENLTNYTQKNPIIGAADPFSENFDAGIVYAPVLARKFYAGIHLQFKKS